MAHMNSARILTRKPCPLLRSWHGYERMTNTTKSKPFIRYKPHSTLSTSVSATEMTHFASLASSWWDPLGPSRILHLMNPLRHEFISSCLSESLISPQQESHISSNKPGNNTETMSEWDSSCNNQNTGLDYLDIGCGGGIFAESLARTIPISSSPPNTSSAVNARSLLAIDPSPVMIEIALSHARKDPTLYSHLVSSKFQYKNTSLEDLITSSSTATVTTENNPFPDATKRYDVITLFEVLEHVDPANCSPEQFLRTCLRLLKPGGWLIGSTIARTQLSYIINQVLAESPWPIGVVPKGTHQWDKFVNPEELRGWAKGFRGNNGSPLLGNWKCIGAVYLPGMGWKLAAGVESWGNYFWAMKRT
ncbi:Hexaprenyldihydroxybenzoate methyltransferase, mitochondrial [Myotisia sp. PD_48]|nr:Hexaprenyldihydroxybenzoate methyltransferase, mitochondrial [Myotisia sp. PD_48]